MAHDKYVTEFQDKDGVVYGVMDDEVREEVAEAKGAIDSKAPVISRTVSGNIVSFADGADGMPLSSCVVQIDPVQAEGTPTPENPLPISGWTRANVYRWGHNAAPVMVIGVAISSTDGSESTANDKATTPFIPVDFDAYPDYYLSGITDRLRAFVCAYNAKKEFLGRTAAITATYKALTNSTFTYGTAQGSGKIAYLRIMQYENSSLQGSISEVSSLQVQLEPGTAATAYKPYQGQTCSVDWQAAAGTVYGGTLKVNRDGSGALTVDRASKTLTKNDNFAVSTGTPTNRVACSFYQTEGEVDGRLISDRLKSRENSTGGYSNNEYEIWGSTTAARCWISVPTTIDTVEKFKTWLESNPVQIVYYLATPQTYNLTAEQVLLLGGENNLWADTGNISIVYPADTQTYVDTLVQTATDPDGNVVTVSGSTPSITGESGKRYVCGTVDSISITPPQTGIIDVVFTSGTTPTVLTVPNTVLFPGWFDPTSLDASTKYEINIMNGTDGAVMAWPI